LTVLEFFLAASAVIFDGMINPVTLEAQACAEAVSLASDLHTHKVLIVSF
jgi:hypothetical protein